MITAPECRELARHYRNRADDADVLQRASLLRNMSHSFSGLATQLDALSEQERAASVGGFPKEQ